MDKDLKQPSSVLVRKAIVAKPSPIHGYGIFAEEVIQPNEVIEVNYLLLLGSGPNISNYVFYWDDYICALPLGFGPLYNHASHNNAFWVIDKKIGTISFMAKRLINPGEEIFIDYGKNWFKTRDLLDRTIPHSRLTRILYSLKRFSKLPIIRLAIIGAVLIVLGLKLNESNKYFSYFSEYLSKT